MIHAQVVRVNNGVSITSLSLKDDSKFNLLNDYVTPYNVSLGIDYVERQYWNLSTEIGYIGIGGKDVILNNGLEDESIIIKEKGEYIQLNTTVRVKPSKKYQCTYMGIGPAFNLLIGKQRFKYLNLRDYRINKFLYGVKMEVGINSLLTDKLYVV
jgi:hypothetical protein